MRRAVILLSMIVPILLTPSLQAQQLVTGLTDETIFITSDFTGTELTIFGTINDLEQGIASRGKEVTVKHYDLVVVLEGPRKPGIVRKKERAAGIWLNGANVTFDNIPSSYLMLSTADSTKPGFGAALQAFSLGFDNMDMGNVTGTMDEEAIDDFKDALIRLKAKDELYTQDVGVEFLGDNLFRARLAIPALIPVGPHKVHGFLFRDNELISRSMHEITVQKRSFEQAVFDFSRDNSYLYGLVCVVIAMLTGWLSSVIFRRD